MTAMASSRFMRLRDVIYLIVKPFLGERRGPTNAETLSQAVEHASMKSEAAARTQLTDEELIAMAGTTALEAAGSKPVHG